MDRAAMPTGGALYASKFPSSEPDQPTSRHLAAPNIPFLNRAESNLYVMAQRKETKKRGIYGSQSISSVDRRTQGRQRYFIDGQRRLEASAIFLQHSF